MESYEIAKENALKHLNLADHILTMTYPLVQDPKLLKFVMKNLHTSIKETVLMVMQYERLYKRIPPFSDNFNFMISQLPRIFQRYNISIGYVNFINQINELMHKQKESEVEFIKKDKFIFASKDYKLEIISEKEIKDYLTKTKLFVKQMIGVVEENERIYRKL